MGLSEQNLVIVIVGALLLLIGLAVMGLRFIIRKEITKRVSK